ncbi:MAG TPA: hypothetical protein VHM26_06585 [Chitinophagaceae bacterium]|jgi:hypothetical protein|nr:hypothetical protein [Chitinophagaceae bacterium]
MSVLIFVLFLSPWLYFVGFVIYIIVQLAKKRKLPIRLVIADMIGMALLLVLYVLVYTHNLAFIGEYEYPADNYGQGIGNAFTTAMNLTYVIAAFFIFQLYFMSYINRETKKMRKNERLPVI